MHRACFFYLNKITDFGHGLIGSTRVKPSYRGLKGVEPPHAGVAELVKRAGLKNCNAVFKY